MWTVVVLLSWVVLHVPITICDLVLNHNQHFINILDYIINQHNQPKSSKLSNYLPKAFVKQG
jgi:hypothetical protein